MQADGTSQCVPFHTIARSVTGGYAAGARHIAVATTTNAEMRPGISYLAATNSLWVMWHRYASASDPSARLYYGPLDRRHVVYPDVSYRPAVPDRCPHGGGAGDDGRG